MEKKSSKLPLEALTKGYILLPKLLLETLLTDIDRPLTDLEATLTLLTHVNYKDTICHFNGQELLCKRGESLYSTRHWAKLFHWERGKVRWFITKLANDKLIELLPITECNTTHLRVLNYDLWTGSRQAAMKHEHEKQHEQFYRFWEEYHLITCTRKMNRGRAEREWNRMPKEEQAKALQGINNYYFSLTDTRFCKQAAAYLADKAYLNE